MTRKELKNLCTKYKINLLQLNVIINRSTVEIHIEEGVGNIEQFKKKIDLAEPLGQIYTVIEGLESPIGRKIIH